jgi:glycosyltransferase involved in cell wall biosynthesis
MQKPNPTQPGLSIIIPCLNEEMTLARAIRQAHAVLREIPGEVLVVDNGSTDESFRLALSEGARVVREPKVGYGSALKKGIEEAQFETVAMVDADLSYPIAEIPKLFETLNSGFDLVLGNRLKGKMERQAMPTLNRYLGTPFLSWSIRRLHGSKVYDCNSGLRVFKRERILALDLQSDGMELASEMLVRAAQSGLRSHEIPIPFFRDQRKRRSHLRRWSDGWRHLKLITNLKFRLLKKTL